MPAAGPAQAARDIDLELRRSVGSREGRFQVLELGLHRLANGKQLTFRIAQHPGSRFAKDRELAFFFVLEVLQQGLGVFIQRAGGAGFYFNHGMFGRLREHSGSGARGNAAFSGASEGSDSSVSRNLGRFGVGGLRIEHCVLERGRGRSRHGLQMFGNLRGRPPFKTHRWRKHCSPR